MEREIQVANCRLILAKTSSPGIALTRPERRSFSLDFATTAHFRSISRSGGFKVRNNESTMKVLSSTGKDSTSCMISMAVGMFQLVCLPDNSSIDLVACSTRELRRPVAPPYTTGLSPGHHPAATAPLAQRRTGVPVAAGKACPLKAREYRADTLALPPLETVAQRVSVSLHRFQSRLVAYFHIAMIFVICSGR